MCAKPRKNDLEVDQPLLHQKQEKADYGTMLDKTKYELVKPNGGWGWMVVLGVALSNMTTQSLVSNFSLLFIQRLYELNIETSGAAVILSAQATLLNFSGLITGPVIKTFTPRKVAAMGGLLFATGLALTSYSSSMLTLILTYSVFTGLGLGLLQPSTFVVINSYFTTKKGRAVGLAVAGTGIGQMLLPQAVRFLLEYYGFQGTVIFLSALSLHSLLAATLYQPVKWHMKKKLVIDPESVEKLLKEPATIEDVKLKDNHKVEATDCKSVGVEMDETLPNVTVKSKPKGPLQKFVQYMDLTLLKDLSFLNILIGLALVYAANINFTLIFPFLLNDIGFTKADIAMSMTVLAAADIIGRLLVPTITDLIQMKSRTCFFVGAALSAIARSTLATQTDYFIILVAAAVTGLVRAALIVNFSLTITEHVTQDKLPAALGLHMVFKAITIISFGPLIGYIRDTTKSYSLCLHIVSVFFLALPSIAWFLEVIFKKCCKKT